MQRVGVTKIGPQPVIQAQPARCAGATRPCAASSASRTWCQGGFAVAADRSACRKASTG